MAALSSETVQAACVAVNGHGVLIESRGDAERSDFALRLIDRGAQLVADGQTMCVRQDGALIACAPAQGAGQMAVRGVGSIAFAHLDRAPVALIAVLLDDSPRFPEDRRTRTIAGVEVPVLALAAHDAAAPIKIELAVRARA